MALITCSECNKEVSDKALSCIHCGNPIASAPKEVSIRFMMLQSQLMALKCKVFVNGVETINCKQGDTVSIECTEPTKIGVKVTSHDLLEVIANPGERYNVAYRGLFQKLYLEKVDVLTGNAGQDHKWF